MKRIILHSLMFGLLAMGMTGCATRYQVRVDALSTGEGVPVAGGGRVSYTLASAIPEVKETDLFFKELSRHLTPVLADSNFVAAAEGAAADVQITVNAYISDPMVETQTYSDPVPVDYGYRMHYYRVPVIDRNGRVVRYYYSGYYGPRYYGTAWVERSRQVTVFDKVLKLSASRIAADGSAADELWTISLSLRDGGTDYRAALPFLMVAARPYIGRRTEGEILVTIPADDPRITTYGAGLAHGR
jgi:hypothetical protein